MVIVDTDLETVQSLVEKLNNPIDEIRCRALLAISSKLQRKLFTPDERTSVALAAKTIEWLNKSPLLNPLDILQILQFLVTKQPVRQTVIHEGGLAVLAKVRNQISSDNIRALIDDILSLISGGEITASDCCQLVNLQQPTKWMQPSGYFNFSGSSMFSSTSAFSNTHSQSSKWPLRSRETNALVSNSNEYAGHNEVFRSHPSTSIANLSINHVFAFPLLPLTKTDGDVLHACVNSIKSTDPDITLSGVKFFQDVVLEDFAAEVFLQRPAIVEILLRLLSCNDASLMNAAADALICLCEKLVNRVYFHLDPDNYCTAFDASQPSMFVRSSTDVAPNQLSSSQGTSIPTTVSSAPNASTVNDSIHVFPGFSSDAPDLPFHTNDTATQLRGFSLPELCVELLYAVSCGLRVAIDPYISSPMHDSFQDDNDVNRTKSTNSDFKLNPEAGLLQLMRLSIRLLLISISPIERAKTKSESSNHSTTRSTSWNWMFETVPLEKDLISPYELPRGFLTCLEPWGQLLSLLASTWNSGHLCGSSSVGWSSTEIAKQITSASLPHITSRHVYLATLGNMYFLISSLFTPETALCILPIELRNQLSVSLLDLGLLLHSGSSNESERSGLPAYVSLFNSGIYKTWQLLILLEHSMTQLIKFLSCIDAWDQSNGEQEISEGALNFAVEGVDSVDIVGSIRFASEFVRFLNELSMNDRTTSSSVLWRGQLVLLRLLSHPIVSVRKATYNQMRDVIQHATDPRVVSDPLQRVNALEFVLRDEVLCELLEFGLKDDCVEIRTSAEQLLWCLLDSYEYLPQSSWRTLYRLCMEPASSCAVGFRCRPLNIILGIYSIAKFNSTESDNNFGALALDWCLGRMTSAGRIAASVERTQPPTERIEVTEDVWTIHSCCRLLFHPTRPVRSEAALVMSRHLRKFFASRSTSTASRSSSAADARLVTGMSTMVDVGEKCETTIRQTSTPIEPCRLAAQIIPVLIDCLVTAHGEVGASQAPPYVLNYIDRLGCETTDTQHVNGIVRVMRLFIDDSADLNVRRAAGEQVIVLAKHPGAALTWLSDDGLICVTQCFSRLLRDSLSGDDQGTSPDYSKITMTLNAIGRVLFPVFVRLLLFIAVWDTAGRTRMSVDKELLFNLLYLRILYSGSGEMHGDLTCLIALILFHPVIREAEECPVCLPATVFAGYLLPFTCPTYSLRSQWREISSSGTVLHSPFQALLDLLASTNSDENTLIFQSMVRRAFRVYWSFASHGGLCAFVRHILSVLGVLPTGCIQVDPSLVDVCFKICRDYTPFLGQLSMSSNDLILVLSSQWDASVLLCLTAAQRATNHASVMKAVNMLHRCCAMCACLPASGFASEFCNSSSSWWSCGQLERFLSTLPACSADFQLLILLLQTIERLGLISTTPFSICFGTTSELCQWLLQTLVDDRGPRLQ